MIRKSIRQVAVGAALAGSVVGLAATDAFAGTATQTPTSGTFSTSFLLGGYGSCGGSGGAGYRYHEYIRSDSTALSSVNWTTLAASSGSFQILFDTVGNPVSKQFPAASPSGLITPPAVNLLNLTGLADGVYQVGVACSNGSALDGTNFWEKKITITTSGAGSYVAGAAPAAPSVAASNGGNKVINYTITAPGGTTDPAITSYTLTATPTSGPAIVKTGLSAGAGTLTTADGVVNNIAYTLKATATNSVGTSADSATATATATPPVQGAVTNLTANPVVESLNVTWTAPAGDIDPLTGYTVAISPNVGGPFTVAAGTTSKSITGLTAGVTYTVTVTPTHAGDYSAASASTTGVPLPSAYIVQDITVVRPAGAIVLTQRCGVNGYLPAIADDNVFGAVAEKAATYTESSVYGTGSRPYQYTGSTLGSLAGGSAPTTPTLGGPADGLFSQYPYPVDANQVPNAVYPTHCGIDLGKASLITSGPKAGQYFKAIGNLNEITLVNTRDNDSTKGWTLNGTASDFVNSADSAKKFSGDLLGWNPMHTADSGATLDNYNMTVTQGATVAPAASASGNGLGVAKALSSAAAGSSLGISVENARLKLLVPVTASSGTYTATVTFTTI